MFVYIILYKSVLYGTFSSVFAVMFIFCDSSCLVSFPVDENVSASVIYLTQTNNLSDSIFYRKG